MTIELTLTNALTICALFVMALWALVKVISGQQEKRLSEKFDTLGKQVAGVGEEVKKEAAATRELERAFHNAQVDLARNYVRRDDFIQHLGGLNTRIDNFALGVERRLDQLLKR